MIKKKMISYSLLLLISFCITSCFEVDPPLKCEECGNKWVIKDFRVSTNQWEKVFTDDGLFLFYEVIFDFPEMTTYVYDNGITNVYYESKVGDLKVQQPLPHTSYHETDGVLWSQTVTFNFATGNPGTIAFTVTNSDFEKGVPDLLHFRVVSTW